MGNASLYHLQLNVSPAGLLFYRAFFAELGYRISEESDQHLAASDGQVDFWVIETDPAHAHRPYHRKGTGINHLSFRLSSRAEVDDFVRNFLTPRGITPLYDSPKVYPEYAADYYAVYFEDPDRIKLEVMALVR
ncbi:MAG: VOC family protein [Patescibacteria group bacterium]